MGCPRSLTTDEMTLYVVGNFEWYRREVAFPPRPLPSNYEELCPGFALAKAEEYAWYYEVPARRPTWVNDQGNGVSPLRVAVEHLLNIGQDLRGLPIGSTQRLGRGGELGRESWFTILIMAFPLFRDTKEMADHVGETFKWHLRRASHPPRSLSEDYQDLCPSFALPNVEEAARNFNIPEMVYATFYAMLVNDAVWGYPWGVGTWLGREKEQQQ
ncbi:hypothetical protein Cgig2_009101 [Carnegiea gigantea]|uniref:Uncharacterized protein n=1 Tax=Carnegiea gigantea TaxID=171969 RepID=A0A9Q1KEI6_9CARY|nr:hypothetical protein Cgig2_009101 [Carnegiea gigantea]